MWEVTMDLGSWNNDGILHNVNKALGHTSTRVCKAWGNNRGK